MSSNRLPDYDLEDMRVVSSRQELRAMADPLRSSILDLVLERAATVAELAAALGRPKSTVAHHVGVLVAADMLKVVRTRRVRAIDERFYGRTSRIFYVGKIQPDEVTIVPNVLTDAAAESVPAYEGDQLRGMLRYARIPPERAAEFWDRVFALVNDFSQLPRAGETVYGLVVGLYPTDHPTLPDPGNGGPA
jgi:DNA-binding transcriptional ArsR family regulator